MAVIATVLSTPSAGSILEHPIPVFTNSLIAIPMKIISCFHMQVPVRHIVRSSEFDDDIPENLRADMERLRKAEAASKNRFQVPYGSSYLF